PRRARGAHAGAPRGRRLRGEPRRSHLPSRRRRRPRRPAQPAHRRRPARGGRPCPGRRRLLGEHRPELRSRGGRRPPHSSRRAEPRRQGREAAPAGQRLHARPRGGPARRGGAGGHRRPGHPGARSHEDGKRDPRRARRPHRQGLRPARPGGRDGESAVRAGVGKLPCYHPFSKSRLLGSCAMSEPTFRSVVEMFQDRVRSTPNAEAMSGRRDGKWYSLTWSETAQRVRAVACGLLSLGLKKGERAAILATSSPDWVIADLGILSAGGATSTIYTSNTAEESAYILVDSGARFCFAENPDQEAKVREARGQLGGVAKLILMNG